MGLGQWVAGLEWAVRDDDGDIGYFTFVCAQYKAMRKWRLERGIDRILTTPYPVRTALPSTPRSRSVSHYASSNNRTEPVVAWEGK